MSPKRYNQIRAAVAVFVGTIVSIGVTRDSYLLAVAAMVTGMMFLVLVRTKAKIKSDEREITVREKAAQATYAIFAPTLGLGAFLLMFPTHSRLSVFAKGDFLYLESLGMIFSYLTLFLISLYAISYGYFNRKYGGGDEE